MVITLKWAETLAQVLPYKGQHQGEKIKKTSNLDFEEPGGQYMH